MENIDNKPIYRPEDLVLLCWIRSADWAIYLVKSRRFLRFCWDFFLFSKIIFPKFDDFTMRFCDLDYNISADFLSIVFSQINETKFATQRTY